MDVGGLIRDVRVNNVFGEAGFGIQLAFGTRSIFCVEGRNHPYCI